MRERTLTLPSFPTLSPHRLMSLLHSERAGLDAFEDVARLLRAALQLRRAPEGGPLDQVAGLALRVARFRTGLRREELSAAELERLLAPLAAALPTGADPVSSFPHLPDEWLERNEAGWRRSLHPDRVADLTEAVAHTLRALSAALAGRRVRYHAGLNTLGVVREDSIDDEEDSESSRWMPIYDRKRTPVPQLRITAELEELQERYLDLCHQLRQRVAAQYLEVINAL